MSLPHTCFLHLSPTPIPKFTTGSQILNKGAITNKDQDDREEEILEMAERTEGGKNQKIEEMDVKDKIERKEMKRKLKKRP